MYHVCFVVRISEVGEPLGSATVARATKVRLGLGAGRRKYGMENKFRNSKRNSVSHPYVMCFNMMIKYIEDTLL